MTADRDITSLAIRCCRWALWAAALILWCLMFWLEGAEAHKHWARIALLGTFVASTGNLLLYQVERRRKQRLANIPEKAREAGPL
jgi:hypothetical protein